MKAKSRLLNIIHYQPLEFYPPVQNLIRYIKHSAPSLRVCIITTRSAKKKVEDYSSEGSNIKIVRIGTTGQQGRPLNRYWNYLKFNGAAIIMLFRSRPSCVLYFETLSSFPAFVYKRFFADRTGIFIHYHEYTMLAEYRNGMKISKFFHQCEKKLYPKALWISHTNECRLSMFLADNAMSKTEQTHVLPNYPPISWQTVPIRKMALPLKIVYAGALSADTMYTKEFAEWVESQNGYVNWDIYSFNITDEANRFFANLNSAHIKIKGALSYLELPAVLKKYDIGVILYKGHIDNYVYNAPNKLFEYLACGLDVWFPAVMKGSLPYENRNSYPRVFALPFDDLHTAVTAELLGKPNLPIRQIKFYSEEVLGSMLNKILETIV